MADAEFLEGPQKDEIKPRQNLFTNNNKKSLLTRKLGSINNNKKQLDVDKISDSEEMTENEAEEEGSELYVNDFTENSSETELKADLSSINDANVVNSDEDENVEINEDEEVVKISKVNNATSDMIKTDNLRSDTSLLSSNSSNSSSPSLKSSTLLSNNSSSKPFQPPFNNSLTVMAEWYKQYEAGLLSHRNAAVLAGLHYLKPPGLSRINSPQSQQQQQQQQQQIQSSPIHSQTSQISNESLMERFYSNLPQSSANTSSSSAASSSSPSFSSLLKSSNSSSSLNSMNIEHGQQDKLLAHHQALLAQYAQQFYSAQPNNPAAFNAIGQHSNQVFMHHGLNPEAIDKERYLASINLYNHSAPFHHAPPPPPPPPPQQQQQQNSHFNLPHFSHQRQQQSGSISPGTQLPTGSQPMINQMAEINDRERNSSSGNNINNNGGGRGGLLRRGNSRSPSPSSSQQSGNEEEEDCDDSQSINAANGEWTYEEQFKQLYELSDDAKRKEFLDDLFAFMQKRGSPVNRIPIMAKHVLDLYELYRLVVAKGGLVEVINKKLWREITKGLNLPSSITSAAFTLRTQYMKYLYPYECEKLKLSTPQELQAAIDGNRREGRRPVYGFEYSSPTGMSNGGSSNINSGGSNMPNSSSLSNSGLVKQNLPNELLNGLTHHPGLQHHPHLLPPPPLPPQSHHHHHHHNPFLAAAAAAAAAAQQQHSNHIFDAQSSIPTDSAHHLPLPPNPNSIPPFLKSFYFEMNTPPPSSTSSSSTSSTSSTSSSSANRNSSEDHQSPAEQKQVDNENAASTPRANMTNLAQCLKRPFDHLDQNSERQNSVKQSSEVKEPMSKKVALEQAQSGNSKVSNLSSTTTSQQQSNKMKVKILSKESANEILFTDKSISISIELNGLIYQGTLYASSNSSSSSSSSSNSINSSPTSTNSTTNKFDSNIKTDNVVF